MQTAVAFLIFNRPETTARVFAAIRAARPPRLLVVADGPRAHVPTDAERCRAARAVIDGVDWDCDVLANFSDRNMGCRRRVASGLDWVFDRVEEAIILEDDCLPHPTFFPFCEELLARYREESRIMAISGGNFLPSGRPLAASYYFSRFCFIWGWASWRRAWRLYDADMEGWPQAHAAGRLASMVDDRLAMRYWTRKFAAAHRGDIDTWDYAWLFSLWVNGAVTAVPAVNLVSNIGFQSGGSHTTAMDRRLANLPMQPMVFPLRHPQTIARDAAADKRVQRTCFYPTPLMVVQRLFHHALKGKPRPK